MQFKGRQPANRRTAKNNLKAGCIRQRMITTFPVHHMNRGVGIAVTNPDSVHPFFRSGDSAARCVRRKDAHMKEEEFTAPPCISYTYCFEDGTTSTVHVGDIDENGNIVTEEMIELLYQMDEESHDYNPNASSCDGKTSSHLVKGVYDTLKERHVNVPVSEEVYNEYMRGEWAIKDQDKKFYAHEIQLSQLVGGDDANFDNFGEFVSDDDDPYEIICQESLLRILREELDKMDYLDRNLIESLYFDNLSEREYGDMVGLPQKTVNNRKRAFLRKLKEKMKNF